MEPSFIVKVPYTSTAPVLPLAAVKPLTTPPFIVNSPLTVKTLFALSHRMFREPSSVKLPSTWNIVPSKFRAFSVVPSPVSVITAPSGMVIVVSIRRLLGIWIVSSAVSSVAAASSISSCKVLPVSPTVSDNSKEGTVHVTVFFPLFVRFANPLTSSSEASSVM